MEKIIQAIAAGSNTTLYQWVELRSALIKEIEQIAQKTEDQQSTKANIEFIRKSLESYENAPYSIQRVCELVSKPPGTSGAQYSTAQKYFFAIERSLYVTSETSDPVLLGTSKAMEIDA